MLDDNDDNEQINSETKYNIKKEPMKDFPNEEDQTEAKPTKKQTVKKLKKHRDASDDNYSDYEDYDFNSQENFNYSDNEDEDYEEHSKPKKKVLNAKRKRNHKKKATYGRDFLDMEAEENEEADSDSAEGEITSAQQKKLMQQYSNTQYKPRQASFDPDAYLHHLSENKENETEYIDSNDPIEKNALQPSISDPKLWLVKCKIGKERECVQNLYHKYFNFNSKQSQNLSIKILSAASFDSLKGYIYIEAFKEANVREALIGISFLKENSIKIVPLNEMTQVFAFDKISTVELKPKQWVRIKNGKYEGDLAQVIHIEDKITKILIRLLPRIDIENEQEAQKNQKDTKNQKKLMRPKQQLFNPRYFTKTERKHSALLGSYDLWNKMIFKEGFLIKTVRAKALITDGVVPTLEELKIFDISKQQHSDDYNEDENGINGGGPSSSLYDILSSSFQDTFYKNKIQFQKNDRVRIIKGNLKGLSATVMSHSDGVIHLYPLNLEGMKDTLLDIPEDFVVREFLPGDAVQIIGGSNIGKVGMIVQVDDEVNVVFCEATNDYYKISPKDLISANSTSELLYLNNNNNNMQFKRGDLVKINNTNNICYILCTSPFQLKVIDTKNYIKIVSVRDVFKIGGYNHRTSAVDSKQNPISKDDIVEVVKGLYKGKKGVIKCIFKFFVFLYNKDYCQSHGIFVDICHNLEILGSELLIDMNGNRGKINRKIVPENIRMLIGKEVVISGGGWKGYKGIVKNATDVYVYVELFSKPMTIRLESKYVLDENNENKESGNNWGGKATPKQIPNTPAYYPQSPGGFGSVREPNSVQIGW